MNDPITDWAEGMVTRVSAHGFQLRGRDGWLNLSRYAKPAPALPQTGMAVRVGLDARGFVRSIGAAPTSTGLTLSHQTEPVREMEAPETRERLPPNTDTRITRMNVLSTATAILSSASGSGPAP